MQFSSSLYCTFLLGINYYLLPFIVNCLNEEHSFRKNLVSLSYETFGKIIILHIFRLTNRNNITKDINININKQSFNKLQY